MWLNPIKNNFLVGIITITLLRTKAKMFLHNGGMQCLNYHYKARVSTSYHCLFPGKEVAAEQLLEELDNGVLLCQLVGVLQNTIKKCCSSKDLRVSHMAFSCY